MGDDRVPRTPEELAALEAAYVPFEPAAAWSAMDCDAQRWQRHADALAVAVESVEAKTWSTLRERFMRAAALDSTVLSELARPMPDATTVVLRSSISDEAWTSVVDATRLVVECHRRALVVAGDAATAGRPLDASLFALLQDLIVESQETYTVSDEGGNKLEVDLPRRQYKPVTNYALRAGNVLVPFAPAARVPAEMSRLAAELASDAFAALHPVIQSAYAHVAITRIHPFSDGNGRLARTVASIPLLLAAGLPQLILADQWPAYVQALAAADEGDPSPIVELFLAAQVNTMDLARGLLVAPQPDQAQLAVAPVTDSPDRTLLDLVQVHLRTALGVPAPEWRMSVTRAAADPADPATTRVTLAAATEDGRTDVEFAVEADGGSPGWLRLVASSGEALDIWRDDVYPVPLEVVHLRVQAWLERVLWTPDRPPPLRQGSAADPITPTPARGLFVLGVPRSGTTVMGSFLGSHPDVLNLAEYGGFYIAHSVVPGYLNRFPGRQHDEFLAALRTLAAEHAIQASREHGCAWFCDATPWNLEISAALAELLPDAVFVLMLRHFSGAVLSLGQFDWAGQSWAEVAQLWVSLNRHIAELPADRTLVVGYDELAAHPAETLAGIREALSNLDLDAALFEDTRLATSHASVVGQPRPTVASTVDGEVVLQAISSLDAQRWTPEVHAEVWPVVAEVHRALLDRFAGVYVAPPRPAHVPGDEW